MGAPYAFDPGFPKTNGQVQKMLIYKGVLYISGTFTTVNGQPRGGFAAIDPISDALLPLVLAPGITPGGNISDFVIVNDVIYAVGGFLAPRNNAAAWDIAGNLLAWNPNLDASGLCINTDGTTIYVGGSFSLVNGAATRKFAAAFDMAAGTVKAWNPDMNNGVSDILISGATVYLTGSFSSANGGGATRHRAAAVDSVTGTVNAFDPDLDSSGLSLELYGGMLYIAGFFNTVNGGAFTRPGLAAFDPVTGAAVAGFNANVGGIAFRVRRLKGVLYLGGIFSIGSAPQLNFAIVSPANGALLTPELNFTGTVQDFAVLGNRTFIGGFMTEFLGTTRRNNIAAYAFGTNTLKSLSITTDQTIEKAILVGGTVYIFGNFTSVAGSNGSFTRHAAAAIDLATSAILPWNPIIVGHVLDAIVVGSSVYMVGLFNSINATGRSHAGAVDTSGNLLPWNPDITVGPGSLVNAITFNGVSFFLGGFFSSLNGGAVLRNCLAIVDSVNGTADPVWDPDVSSSTAGVRAMAFDGTWLYVGGQFTAVGGQPRSGLARVSPVGAGAVDLTWVFDATAGAGVRTITEDGSGNVYVGGFFTDINGTPQDHLAKISSGGVLQPGWANAIGLNGALGWKLFGFSGQIFVSYTADYIQNGALFRPHVFVADQLGNPGAFAPAPDGFLSVWSFSLNFGTQTFIIAGDFDFVGIQEALSLAAFDVPAPPPTGIPQAPNIRFLNRRPQRGRPALTMLRWDQVTRGLDNSQVPVTMYRVYRSSSKNLEDTALIAEISTKDLKGDVDTLFTEEIDGYYKYCVSAVNDAGEGGKSCKNFLPTEQLERLG